MNRYLISAVAALLAAPALAASPAPATAQPSPDPDPAHPAKTYDVCVQLSKQHPDQALEMASKWDALGGGDGARHCRALALIGLEEYGQAAQELEDLAQKSKAEATLRADLLEQAGQA